MHNFMEAANHAAAYISKLDQSDGSLSILEDPH